MSQGIMLVQPRTQEVQNQPISNVASTDKEFENVYKDNLDQQEKSNEAINAEEEKPQVSDEQEAKVQDTKDEMTSCMKEEVSSKEEELTDLDEVTEEIKAISEAIKKLMDNEELEPNETIQALLAFLQSNDMEVLTQFLVDQYELESPMDLLLQPDLMETLNQLQNIALKLQDLLATGVDLKQVDATLVDENPMFQQLLEQMSQTENKMIDQSTSLTNEQIVVEVEDNNDVVPQQTSQDTAKQDQSESNGSSKEQTNLFLNKLNTIEVMKDKIVDQTGDKNMERLLKQEIVQQIVNRIAVTSSADMTSMTIRLKPEHLGNLVFSVSTNKGTVTAQFVAENNTVKEAIEMNLFQLKTTLEQQGINVDDIEVSVADNGYFDQRKDGQSSFEQQHQNQNNRRIASIPGTSEEEEEVVEENIAMEEQHTVDFSA
ncbi:flagellar hook-length control protein FliK [Vallitalea okinawensis]|uniref:flagellar hook-length control protein FliK n=1 Tax=Vallitalea okinawensis TaxID=2078660 RepID=UPI000CFA8C85|nr:flagellar hook-length control protein FliK [Vallitalea okinawensis]